MPKLIDPAMNLYSRQAREAVDDAFSTRAMGKSSLMAEIVSPLNDELLRRTERVQRMEMRVASQAEHIRVLRETLATITDVYAATRKLLSEKYADDGWSADTMTIDKARAVLAAAGDKHG